MERETSVSFGPDFSSCNVGNSVLVNRRENLFRCKNILELFIVKSSISRNELFELFEQPTNVGFVKGVHTVPFYKRRITDNWRAIYKVCIFFPGLRETIIGEFINTHPDLIRKAFKTSHFLYEPYLEWLEHDGTVEDKAINPDLIVRRPDGLYDIYRSKSVSTREEVYCQRAKENRSIRI